MSETMLEQFLHAARSITGAERGLVVDTDLHILHTINVEPALVSAGDFIESANRVLQEAITQHSPRITNNVITDVSQAPTTNTNFANLRVIVAIPVGEQGAVYLEKHISKGVIDRQTVDKLMRLADETVNDGQAHDEDSLLQKYHGLE